jgi:hypothetical protein
MPGIDPLNAEQRLRLAALYAAREVVIGDSPLASEMVEFAHYILTGQPLESPRS